MMCLGSMMCLGLMKFLGQLMRPGPGGLSLRSHFPRLWDLIFFILEGGCPNDKIG